MAEKYNGWPAFPVVDPDPDDFYNGMSLRDYFAGQALLNMNPISIVPGDSAYELRAEAAYAMADAMLKERDKREGE